MFRNKTEKSVAVPGFDLNDATQAFDLWKKLLNAAVTIVSTVVFHETTDALRACCLDTREQTLIESTALWDDVEELTPSVVHTLLEWIGTSV